MKRSILAALALFLAAAPSSAQTVVDASLSSDAEVSSRSERTGSIQLRLGSYRPLIDNEETLTRDVFNDFFDGGKLLLFEMEGQRFLYQGYGSAGISLSAGYAEKYAEGTPGPGAAAEPIEKSGLQVFPLSLGVFYKLDYAAERWGIPVVPYAEASLRYVPYRFANSAAGISGGKRGYGLTAGVQLMLDFLEPSMARSLDSDLGVNHTYLFAEYTRAEVNNFGKAGLDLSSRGWMFGLALDY